MKIKYECSVCGAQYDKDILALHCEQSHPNISFTETQYTGMSRYPLHIKVMFTNGASFLYRRENQVDCEERGGESDNDG